MTHFTTNHGVQGPTDLYDLLLEVKNGKRGHTHITKRQCRELGIDWSFVENSVQVLGLKIRNYGARGWSITAGL